MSFPRYPEYKDSGVEWLGEVPRHWEVATLYGSVVERNESNKGMVEDNLLSLSYGRIVQKDITSNDGLLPESFETYQIVRPGNIVFRLTDLQNDKRSLRSALVEETGIITFAYLAVAPRSANSRFMNYLFRAYDTTKVFYSMGGGSRQSMKFADLKRMPTLIPPLPEQTQIATFLDRETAKIDVLVAEQRRLMALLKEKRQAVISHAVTRGLNPNAPMKPSGIEWLGDVPAHWDVLSLKRFCDVRDGTHDTPDFVDESETSFPFVTSKDLVNGKVSLADTKHVAETDYHDIARRSGVRRNDVLMPMIGSIGGAVLVETDVRFAIKNIALFKSSERYNSRWLQLLLDSDLSVVQFDLNRSGGVQGFVALGTLRNLSFPSPPTNEQEEIVGFLDQRLCELETLTTEAQRAIDLLQERRAALISAAVTGQIDVRGSV